LTTNSPRDIETTMLRDLGREEIICFTQRGSSAEEEADVMA
jgi:hypothetical protein